jgi:hypothetical protein
MGEVNEADIIAIGDAVEEYKKNRRTLDKLIDDRKLSVVKIEGDRKIYLLRAELDALFKPRIVRPAERNDPAAG